MSYTYFRLSRLCKLAAILNKSRRVPNSPILPPSQNFAMLAKQRWRTSIVYGPSSAYHRSPLSRSSPAVAAALSPISSPGPPVSSLVSSPPDSVATRRFSSRPHHLFNAFLKVLHRKISQCSPNKDGGCRFEYTT